MGDPLKIHRDLLHRNPKLATLDVVEKIDAWTGAPVPNPQSASLKRISRSAGHVLVQYLYTDSYRTLKWVGPADSHKETVAKLETAFEVYATAREFELEGLEALATEQIALLSKDVDAFTIIDVVKRVYPCAKGNDNWFPIFIKNTIRTAFETSLTTPPAETASEITADNVTAELQTAQDVPLAKLLLQSALEVHREKIEALTFKPTRQPAAGLAFAFGSSTAMNVSDNTTRFGAWGSACGSAWDKRTAKSGAWNFGGTKEKAKEEEAAETIQEPVDLEPVSAKEVKQDGPHPKNAEAVDEFAARDPEPVPQPAEEKPTELLSNDVQATDDPWTAWSITASKKYKKKKKGKPESELPKEPDPAKEPQPMPMEEPEVMADPAPAISPVEEGWVGAEPNPWPLWRAKKSPRPSM